MYFEHLRGRFPSEFENEFNKIETIFDFRTKHQSYTPFDIVFEKNILSIPMRVYTEENQIDNPVKLIQLSAIQKELLYCFFSRHHNGYVREKCLRKIIHSQNKFTAPYILQLLGEYVIEIIEVIYDNQDELNHINMIEYIRENPQHYEITKQRVYSYWNSYYRRTYPKYKKDVPPKGASHLDYPGIKMVKYLDSLISNNEL